MEFVDQLCEEEGCEIVEDVGEYLDGSLMTPSVVVVRKGRLPPKRHGCCKSTSREQPLCSPQSLVCSPYSDCLAKCIVDDFAEESLKDAKPLKLRISRVKAKKLSIVNNANTSEFENGPSCQSNKSFSRKQISENSQRLSLSIRKHNLRESRYSIEKSLRMGSKDFNGNNLSLNGTTNSRNSISHAPSSGSSRQSNNTLYSMYASVEHKQPDRRIVKKVSQTFNSTIRSNISIDSNNTLSHRRSTAKFTQSSNRSVMSGSKRESVKDEREGKSRIQYDKRKSLRSSVRNESSKNKSMQHTLQMFEVSNKSATLPAVLDNSKINQISKSLFCCNRTGDFAVDCVNSKLDNNENVDSEVVSSNELENHGKLSTLENKIDVALSPQECLCKLSSFLVIGKKKANFYSESLPNSFEAIASSIAQNNIRSAPNNECKYIDVKEDEPEFNKGHNTLATVGASVDSEYYISPVNPIERVYRDYKVNSNTEQLSVKQETDTNTKTQPFIDSKQSAKNSHAYELNETLSETSEMVARSSTLSIENNSEELNGMAEEQSCKRCDGPDNINCFIENANIKTNSNNKLAVSNNLETLSIDSGIRQISKTDNINCGSSESEKNEITESIQENVTEEHRTPNSKWQNAFESQSAKKVTETDVRINKLTKGKVNTNIREHEPPLTENKNHLPATILLTESVQTIETVTNTDINKYKHPLEKDKVLVNSTDNNYERKSNCSESDNQSESENEHYHLRVDDDNDNDNSDDLIDKKELSRPMHKKMRNTSLVRPMLLNKRRASFEAGSINSIHNTLNESKTSERLVSVKKDKSKRQPVKMSNISIEEESYKDKKTNAETTKERIVATAQCEDAESHQKLLQKQEKQELEEHKEVEEHQQTEMQTEHSRSTVHRLSIPNITRNKANSHRRESIKINMISTDNAPKSYNTYKESNINNRKISINEVNNFNFGNDVKTKPESNRDNNDEQFAVNERCVSKVQTSSSGDNKLEKLPSISPTTRKKSSHKAVRIRSFVSF